MLTHSFDAVYVAETGRTMDLMQFVTFDGREREMAHWDSLFERMDEAFESVKALKPEKTHRWLIEAV
tara:strand:- start:291 stop:491 length:201 start_codon:yes stop_codon:yes gene_type:complete